MFCTVSAQSRLLIMTQPLVSCLTFSAEKRFGGGYGECRPCIYPAGSKLFFICAVSLILLIFHYSLLTTHCFPVGRVPVPEGIRSGGMNIKISINLRRLPSGLKSTFISESDALYRLFSLLTKPKALRVQFIERFRKGGLSLVSCLPVSCNPVLLFPAILFPVPENPCLLFRLTVAVNSPD